MNNDWDDTEDKKKERERKELDELKIKCKQLAGENQLLRKEIQQLEEARYNAFRRIAVLTAEVNINKNN